MATFGFITYTMSNGSNNVSIKANNFTATANSQTLTKYPPVGTGFPFNSKNLRYVRGVSSGGKHAKMIVCDEAQFDALVIGTDTFTTSSGTFTISSKFGERDDARCLGG